jgi:hypothetical protein
VLFLAPKQPAETTAVFRLFNVGDGKSDFVQETSMVGSRGCPALAQSSQYPKCHSRILRIIAEFKDYRDLTIQHNGLVVSLHKLLDEPVVRSKALRSDLETLLLKGYRHPRNKKATTGTTKEMSPQYSFSQATPKSAKIVTGVTGMPP